MSEYYVTIDAVEQDSQDWNHLLRLVIRGQEYLVSATTTAPLGADGSRVWLTWSALKCDRVNTVEEVPGRFVTGQVFLCTAFDARTSE